MAALDDPVEAGVDRLPGFHGFAADERGAERYLLMFAGLIPKTTGPASSSAIDLTAPAVSTPMGSPSATTMVIGAPAGRALRRRVRPQVGGLDRTRAPARDFHRRDAAPEPRP